MKCELNYCIHNNEFNCILDQVQLNSLGMCDECELVTIPEKTLEKCKRARLREIEEIWRNNDQ